MKIDAGFLRRVLAYDPDTGRLRWLKRTPDMFKADGVHTPEHICAKWNSRYAGKEAFARENDGYRCGCILNVNVRAHRVIWALITGAWPENDIDHLNGRRSDNRWVNLRAATRAENLRNRRMDDRNRSGVTGVRRYDDGRRWVAEIHVGGKHKHLGIFDSLPDAAAARLLAERKFGFHPNHGRRS